MSLLEQQNFMARVLVDENLRRSFLREPETIGKENHLHDLEIEQLTQIIPSQINFFADSLFYKRLNEAVKLLPLTKTALGITEFERLFRRFANDFQPQSIKKHLEDSIKFVRFLSAHKLKPLWIIDLARFEAARLEFNANDKNLIWRRFNYDIRQIIMDISGAKMPAQKNYPLHRTFAVWWRFGKNGKPRYFIR